MSYYVTTSIPYVNGEPHLGFALELIMADTLARAARLRREKVIFSTGTDEHGGKIAEKASSLNIDVETFTDTVSQQFRDLTEYLNISNDRFIRTTDEGHIQRAQIIWKKIQGDIYKDSYVGMYCVGCEAFVTETFAKSNDGVCPNHQRPYDKVEEENYFFRLSKYTDRIVEEIKSKRFKIYPESRAHEVLQMIEDGLGDISVSRPKEKITWGIPVPGDKTQVMYVWFEALMNYITVLGYPEGDDFKKYWPANVQVIGKDILRFHAAIWPGMLLALELALPEVLHVHGFLNLEGQKMSKTTGNFIAPKAVVDDFGPDPLRYYLLRHVPSYDDGDFSRQKFIDAYNNELGNELGNAVQRTVAMISRYQEGVIGDIPDFPHDAEKYWQALDECRFDRALDELWVQVRGLNQYIEESKPWAIHKEGDLDHLREVLAYQVSCLLEIADLIGPFMPETGQKITKIFKSGVIKPMEQTLFPRFELPSA
jgi:methionyl-tRNA synthetase